MPAPLGTEVPQGVWARVGKGFPLGQEEGPPFTVDLPFKVGPQCVFSLPPSSIPFTVVLASETWDPTHWGLVLIRGHTPWLWGYQGLGW